MDLSRLAYVTFDAADLGHVTVDVASSNWNTWISVGLKRRRWTDGASFVRDVIAERTRRGFEEADWETAAPVLSHEQAEAMPEAQRDAFAAGLLANTRRLFTPIWERQGRKVVKRDPEAAAGLLALRGEETPSDALFRLANLREEDRALATERAMPVALRAGIPGIAPALRHYDILKKAHPTIALADSLRQSSPSFALRGLLNDATGFQSRTRSLLRSETEWSRTLRGVSANDDVFRKTLASAEFGRGIRLAPALSEALRLSAVSALVRPEPLWRHSAVAAALALNLSGSTSWARDLNRDFGLGLSRSTLAGLAALSAGGDAYSSALTNLAQARPGWLYTVDAILSGETAVGPAARVLIEYDEVEGDETPIESVLTDLHTLDRDGPTAMEARLREDLPRRTSSLDRLDILGRHGGIVLLSLIITVGQLADSVIDQLDDRHERKMESLGEARKASLERIIVLQQQTLEQAREDRNIRGLRRRTRLRLAADAEAAVIRILFPDELVRVLDAKGVWVRVEVTDYRGGVTEGWLPRNVLTPPAP